ncbi:MAG TPA: hypothetical protein VFE24_11950 [Pirellulales bacterium]|jgi:hypothetical protein|nr:hypothetical protein [Pirellulales bacterium]
MLILIQFLLRTSFGMAGAMALTSAKQVTSGYYRNHLYVLLGLNVLATLAALSHREQFTLWPPLAAAILSYAGSVAWLYEKKRAGVLLLSAISAVSLTGAWLTAPQVAATAVELPGAAILRYLDPLSGGLLLGTTLAAMFLGHWYLNTPTMKLEPLRKLVMAMGAATLMRGVVCGAGLILAWRFLGAHAVSPWFVLLHWLAGILGTMVVVWMTWETLKIPNTQSATGILYVGVILTFIGELSSLLMLQGLPYPL